MIDDTIQVNYKKKSGIIIWSVIFVFVIRDSILLFTFHVVYYILLEEM